jgi:hypothetical protein
MADGATEETTGLASVDTVVGTVEALEVRPVDEHVAVFEQAHEQLRRALDDAPED